ncbi:MAG: alpha-2-macroglobulin family protein [Rhizobiales bacterium]|nr:alpha-2-macroglobulin family protein [Hyphomicrobiales bacterium]
MLSSIRAGLLAALVTLLPVVMSAGLSGAAFAQKAFQRDDLADAAIKLEAQIKAESGHVTTSAAALRRDADAAFQRNDFRSGLQILGRITVVAPEDSANWLRIARTVLQIRPGNNRERTTLLERAATAAYLAYQRTKAPDEEAAGLMIISRSYADRQLWRPALDAMRLSLDLREVADIRQQYERMREDHGFRLLDYSVDADASSPRACFQFSEELPGRRTDLSPFVAVSGQDRPALSVDARQLCVEGLKHGERYTVTLRAGIPSTVRETLAKPAEFNIYVRDRKPVVRFSGRAYVLPRVGQRGIPVVSVNTSAVAIEVYRIGDSNLVSTVLGHDFQRTLNRYEIARLREDRGSQVWKGEMKVDPLQNQDVTTAFPVSEAIPNLGAGVYVMVANAANAIGENYTDLATQWFIVSDLGLTAYSGNDGIHTFVHSLETTQGSNGVEVRLLSRNNEVLSTKRTNNNGYVQFEAALARGEVGAAPAMLVATDDKGDYAFLSLRSPAFDLSDRGVSGRNAPAGLDGFVFAERGVYRSGETVHVTALLRDPRGMAAVGVPLTLVVERPDGVEYRRVTVADQGAGGRSLELPLVQSAPTGTWRVRAFTDPKRPAVGEATFMVEDYVPDRIEFELTTAAKSVMRTEPVQVTLDGRYLYGAPAAGLEIAGEVVVAPAAERAGFAGYRFGLSDEEVESTRNPLDGLPSTDNNGRASFPVSLDKVPQSTRPLEASVTVRLAEAGGRAVERKLTLPVTAAGPMIGVRPLFSGRSLGDGEQATFDVIVAGPDGAPLTRNGLRYELLRVETRYQWYRRDNTWDFEPVKLTRRVADGQLSTTAGTPARLSLPVQWGRYRLEISTGERDGPVTSVGFDAGWYTEATADTPDMLEVALDKPEYTPGDNMTVAVTARTAGKVTLNVIGERLLTTVTQDVKPGTVRLQVPVGNDWGTGAYVVATLRRPLDAKAERMPGRAIGVHWFSVNRQARTLAVNMEPPPLTRPGTALRIPVKIGGLAAGDEARIVVAAVDVGILNLTNYKPPAPDDYYLGQRRLSAELRDLYGQLIDGMQGTRGQIRSGGDIAAAELQGSPPAQKPLALYSGVVAVKSDGTAEIVFDIPDFAGTARVMAVAWSKEKVGRAQADVTIRDQVVVTATLPRFLLNGDRGTMHLDVDNVEGQAGDYRVEVKSDGINVTGNAAPQTFKLNTKQRGALSVPLTAPAVGTGNVTVRVSGPGGFALERSYALAVKPATQILARRTVQTVAAGQSVTLSNDLFADLVPGTGSVSVLVGSSTALDAAALLAALDRYPFGCTEQITSRALPLLYVNDLASASHLALDTGVDKRIQESIDRLLSRQGSNGSFGLWSVGGDDVWLDAYVTDFLTRARERDFAVPDTAFRLAVQRLRNFVANAEDPGRNGGRSLAYALYVLARNGAAPVGDLRYFVDTKLDDFTTTIAKTQLAAALGMLGDKVRAERVYAAALRSMAPQPTLEYGRVDYGSVLRDGAALITLASEGGAPRATITGAIQRVEAARALTPYTSTQENAWMVLAARALAKDATGVSLDVAGEKRQGALNRRYLASQVQQPLRIANAGEGPLQAVVTVNGAPRVPEPAAERGFKIERLYFTLDGKPADPTQAKQNDRFAVVLRITEPQPQFGRVIVADYLPAGFEIDNPRLVSSGEAGTLPWIQEAATPVNSEFRDDRFSAAFNRKSGDPAVFTVAYIVRAVSPGSYVHPQAFVEDMYRPDRFGRTGTGRIEITAAR